jgi:hypothetical protein
VDGESRDRGVLVVTWKAPENDGGSAVTGYDVQIDDRSGQDACASKFDDAEDATTPGTSATFTDLTGSAYCIRVRATNDEGDSDWVVAGTVAMAASVPGAPRNLEETNETKNSVILDWDAPRSDGGSDITDYIVEYRKAGSTAWITFDDKVRTATSASVTGLDKDTEYDFRVAAVSAAGTSEYSEVFTHSTDR